MIEIRFCDIIQIFFFKAAGGIMRFLRTYIQLSCSVFN